MTSQAPSAFLSALADIARRDAQRRSRKERIRKSVRSVVVHLMVSTTMTMVFGWVFMLAVGIVHHEWIRQCPTIGYGWATLLAALLRLVLINTTKSRADR